MARWSAARRHQVQWVAVAMLVAVVVVLALLFGEGSGTAPIRGHRG